MSRESDSSSSGPQGRGGAAYPSGTPPYGSPRGDADQAPAPGAAAQPEEPKTETTLTTRIKINIPGSRPIPPVVVRKPVGEESGMSGSSGSGGSAGSRGAPRPARGSERNAERTANTPRPDAPADEAPAGGQAEKPSDWFAPRKGQQSSTGSHAMPPAPGGATPPRPPAGAKPPQRPDLPYFSDNPAPQDGASPFDGGGRPGGGAQPGGASPFDSGPRGGGSPFDEGRPGGASPFDGAAARQRFAVRRRRRSHPGPHPVRRPGGRPQRPHDRAGARQCVAQPPARFQQPRHRQHAPDQRRHRGAHPAAAGPARRSRQRPRRRGRYRGRTARRSPGHGARRPEGQARRQGPPGGRPRRPRPGVRRHAGQRYPEDPRGRGAVVPVAVRGSPGR